jgi:thymidylate kinase
LAAAEAHRWVIVDAAQPQEGVQAAVQEIVAARLEIV